MKNTKPIFFALPAFVALQLGAAASAWAQDRMKADFALGFSSSYVWRGLNMGTTVLQPELSLGYGFGETIARLSGWSELMCVAACFALGLASEEIIGRIVFSKAVQKSTANRIFTYVAIVLFFLAGQYVSVRWMGVSMMEYLEEEFAFVVGLPILGFFVNLLIRAWRIRKIRKLYGDGRLPNHFLRRTENFNAIR